MRNSRQSAETNKIIRPPFVLRFFISAVKLVRIIEARLERTYVEGDRNWIRHSDWILIGLYKEKTKLNGLQLDCDNISINSAIKISIQINT